MRKPIISVLCIITIAFVTFTLGFFLGRNHTRDALSVSVSEKFMEEPSVPLETTVENTEGIEEISFPIPINYADKEALMALPGIGEVLAERIVAFREENGNFSAAEDLLKVEGVGKKRLEEILDLITVGG